MGMTLRSKKSNKRLAQGSKNLTIVKKYGDKVDGMAKAAYGSLSLSFQFAISVHSLSPCLTAGIRYTSFVCLFVCLTTFKGIL